ncbi:hypothetical protein JXR93_10795 [bacterium]|nr:hypothetical protein [bacterium]
MKFIRNLTILAIILTLFSCREEPSKGEIVVVDPNEKVISFKTVDLNKMSSLDILDGEDFQILSGGKITMFVRYDGDPSEITVGEFNKITYSEEAVEPKFRYTISDDVAIPYSIYDYVLLTLYYNLQSAYDFMVQEGMPSVGANGEKFEKTPVFFNLNYEDSDLYGSPTDIKDNAFFDPIRVSLAFLKQDEFKSLALVSNPMIVAHELAHSVFNFLVEGRVDKDAKLYDSVSYYEASPTATSEKCLSSFHLGAMNEGFSDYWGSLKTDSTNLIYLTISPDNMGVSVSEKYDRDLNNNRTLDSSMFPSTNQICLEGRHSYYWAGTIWASSLWEINKTLNIPELNRAIFDSYACLHNIVKYHKTDAGRIRVSTAANCLVSSLRNRGVNTTESCNILKKRFSIYADEIYECE